MFKSLLFSLIILSTSTFANIPSWLVVPHQSEDNSRYRTACPRCIDKKESFYGENMMGSFSYYPPKYVKILKYCIGFSTDLNKMLKRALLKQNNESIKRLECATKGLNIDLNNYLLNGFTLYEIAHEIHNETIIDYFEKQ